MTADKFIELFDCIIQGQNLASDSVPNGALIDLKNVLYHRRYDIERLMTSPQAEEILNLLVEHLYPELNLNWIWEDTHPSGVWTNIQEYLRSAVDPIASFSSLSHRLLDHSEFPHFIGKGKRFVYIDVLKGIFFAGGVLKNLSRRTWEGPVKRILGDRQDHMAIEIAPYVYVVRGIDGEEYTLDDNAMTVEWKQGERLYRFQDERSTNLFHKFLKSQCEIWYSSKPTPQLLLVNKITGQAQYEVDLRSIKGFHLIGPIHRLDAQGQRSGKVLYDERWLRSISPDKASHDAVMTGAPFRWSDFRSYQALIARLFESVLGRDPLRFLDGLEDPQYVLIWINELDRRPLEVELPRLGLKFHVEEVDGKPWWVSEQYAGYRIAEEQYLPILGRMVDYVILEPFERSDASNLVIIPKHT